MSRALSKYRGTLVGALVGDCLGANYEGLSSTIPWEEVTNYTMTRIIDNEEPIPYTDDSAMTRAICRSLIEQNKYDNRSMAHEFVEEFFRDRHRGYGQAVGMVFQRLRDENPEDVTLPARHQFDGQGSYGNGAAMRISPLALFSRNCTEVQEIANKNALITHAHKSGVNGAILQAVAVFKALHLEPPNLEPHSFIDELVEVAEKLEQTTSDKSKNSDHTGITSKPANTFSYAEKIKEMKELLDKGKALEPEIVVNKFGHGISAHEAVPAAIFSFLHKGNVSFDESVNYAISLGGDTDTIASMTGAISGAYWGLEKIPLLWQNKCEAVDEAIEFADKIHKLYQCRTESV